MYKNILIPVVFDDEYDTEASYQVARALADEDAKVTITHVLEAVPNYIRAEIPGERLEATRKDVEKALEASATAYPGAVTELTTGHPGRAIVSYAEGHDIDCIVLASHRPGLEDYFLGSTASRVVRHAKCAVHVLR